MSPELLFSICNCNINNLDLVFVIKCKSNIEILDLVKTNIYSIGIIIIQMILLLNEKDLYNIFRLVI